MVPSALMSSALMSSVKSGMLLLREQAHLPVAAGGGAAAVAALPPVPPLAASPPLAAQPAPLPTRCSPTAFTSLIKIPADAARKDLVVDGKRARGLSGRAQRLASWQRRSIVTGMHAAAGRQVACCARHSAGERRHIGAPIVAAVHRTGRSVYLEQWRQQRSSLRPRRRFPQWRTERRRMGPRPGPPSEFRGPSARTTPRLAPLSTSCSSPVSGAGAWLTKRRGPLGA